MSNKELSFNLGIPPALTSDVADPEIAAEINRIYQAMNTLASKLDEYTGALTEQIAVRPYVAPLLVNRAAFVNRHYVKASVPLLKGTIVLITSGGLLIKGSAASGVHAIVLEDTATDNFAPIAFQGVVDGFAGLVPGQEYVASHTVSGAIATSVPAGQIRRYLGFALNSTTLAFYPDRIGVTV